MKRSLSLLLSVLMALQLCLVLPVAAEEQTEDATRSVPNGTEETVPGDAPDDGAGTPAEGASEMASGEPEEGEPGEPEEGASEILTPEEPEDAPESGASEPASDPWDDTPPGVASAAVQESAEGAGEGETEKDAPPPPPAPRLSDPEIQEAMRLWEETAFLFSWNAEEGTTLTFDFEGQKAGQVVYREFNPTVTGTYVFESRNETGDPFGYLYYYSGEGEELDLIAMNDDYDGLNFRIVAPLQEGKIYMVGARWIDSSMTDTITVAVREVFEPLSLDTYAARTLNGISASAEITGAEQMVYYSFEPAKTETYVFEAADGAEVTLSNLDRIVLEKGQRISKELTAGRTYYYGVRWADKQRTGPIGIRFGAEISIQALPARDALTNSGALGTAEIDVERGAAYFSFTPAERGEYSFVSLASSPTYGVLYDDAGQQLAFGDGNGESGNFLVTATLEPERQYTFGARYGSAEETGSFSVKLSSWGEIKALDAARAARPELGAEDSAEIDFGGRVRYFSFRPAYSGSYKISAEADAEDAEVMVYLYNQNRQPLEGRSSRNPELTLDEADAGRTYYFSVSYIDEAQTQTGSIQIKAVLDRNVYILNAEEVAGSKKTVEKVLLHDGEWAYFSFTPGRDQAGSYEFRSTFSGADDTFCILYDAGWNTLGTDDQSGFLNNFKLTFSLEEGQTYYYGVQLRNGTAETPVELSRAFDVFLLDAASLQDKGKVETRAENVEKDARFMLTPLHSGKYLFEYGGNSNDSVLSLSDKMEVQGSQDAIVEPVASIGIYNIYELTAGMTYLYTVTTEQGSLSSLTVTVSERFEALVDEDGALARGGMTVTADLTRASGDRKYYSFSPEQSGTYIFESRVGDFNAGDPYAYLYDGNMEELVRNDDGGTDSNFLIEYPLEAGNIYYYAVRYYSPSSTGQMELRLRRINNYDELSASGALTAEGATKAVAPGETAYFKFIPGDTGNYYAEASGGTMVLYDSGWWETLNTGGAFSQRLVQGMTYYFQVKNSGDDALTLRLRREVRVSFNPAHANLNTGTPGEISIVLGERFPALNDMSATGAVFKGWYTGEGRKGPRITEGTVLDENLAGDGFAWNRDFTLWGGWVDRVVVTFDPNGGKFDSEAGTRSKTVTPEEPYGELPRPASSGYIFNGWFPQRDAYSSDEEENSARISSDTTVERTVAHTLYAHWKKDGSSKEPQIAESVAVSLDEPSIRLGGETRAVAVITPLNVREEYRLVRWSSENPLVAEVDQNGSVKGIAIGSTKIIAEIGPEGETLTGSATIVVSNDFAQFMEHYNYSFLNTRSSFSGTGSYQIPAERYMQLGFSEEEARLNVDVWGGSCFGMSTSAILFYKGDLDEAKYDQSAREPYSFDAPNTDEAYAARLRGMIELLQISQIMPGGIFYNQPAFDPVAVAAELDRGNPVKFGIRATSGGGHAVVIYSYEKTGDTYVFNIYDNSNFIDQLTYRSRTDYEFHRLSYYYDWIPNNYCTYETILTKYRQIKDANYYNAALLLDTANYRYIYTDMVDLALTDGNGNSAVIKNGEVESDSIGISFTTSDFLAEQQKYILLVPTGIYSVTPENAPEEGVSVLVSDGVTVVEISGIPAGGKATVDGTMMRAEVSAPENAGAASFSVSYCVKNERFDEMKIYGAGQSGKTVSVRFRPENDAAEVGNAALVYAQAKTINSSTTVKYRNYSDMPAYVHWVEADDGLKLVINGSETDTSMDQNTGLWENGGGLDMDNATLLGRERLETPGASLESGTYDAAQVLTLTKTGDAFLYYTADGSDPATSATRSLYNNPITVNHSMTIRAIATRSGYENSEELRLEYQFSNIPAAPQPSVGEGYYKPGTRLEVTLESVTADVTIYYILEDLDAAALYTTADPLLDGKVLTAEPIVIEKDARLTAIAVTQEKVVSEIVTVEYRFTDGLTLERVQDQNGSEITPDSIGGLTELKLLFRKQSEGEKSARVIAAFYRSDDRFITALSAELSIAGDESESELSIPLPGGVEGAAKIHMIIVDENYSPIMEMKGIE